CELGLQLLTKSRADAGRIAQAFVERSMRANVELGEMRVREEPQNADYQVFLGGAYVDMDQYADAIPHLEAGLRLNPRAADAHSDLGTSLMAENRLADAL